MGDGAAAQGARLKNFVPEVGADATGVCFLSSYCSILVIKTSLKFFFDTTCSYFVQVTQKWSVTVLCVFP